MRHISLVRGVVGAALATLILAAAPHVKADSEIVVLAQAPGGPQIKGLNRREIRKLFLGFTIVHEGLTLRPIVNSADPKLYQSFLQRVLFMSAGNYERHTVLRIFKLGGVRPYIATSDSDLIQKMTADPTQVTFVTKAYAERNGWYQITELWR